MSDNRPPVYIEGEHLIIRASAIGLPCLWELIAAGQGEEMQPVPLVLQRAFDEGNLLEPVVVKRLEREYDVVFQSHQSEGELWLSDNVAIRYHSDGIGLLDNVIYVVEIKALSDALWQIAARKTVGGVMDEYNWQLSAMMHDTGLPGLWVAYNKGLPPDANGNRPPCDDAGKLLIQEIKTPPISMTEIELKASLIKEGVYGEPILSSDRPCDSPDHWPCRYLHLRPQPEGTEHIRSVYIPDDKDSFDRLVTEMLTAKGHMDESQQRYKRARDELVKMAQGAAYVQTDRWYIPLVDSVSVNTDWGAMSPELREVVDKYKRRKKIRYVGKVRRLD